MKYVYIIRQSTTTYTVYTNKKDILRNWMSSVTNQFSDKTFLNVGRYENGF